ncbi:autotransporter domain-containing protein [Achromobacter sp. Bel]|uniref:autotransporter domain-containing protein n=1 Tax=Achromobacter sp. Bel TaxID=2727415 RepID=UPI00145D4099|nr:autotransporter domain-containing protein [Achromobacter sp. Bel]NMK46581.1 autotransporter domain-containing protein [Achromobacter sp. Bel]
MTRRPLALAISRSFVPAWAVGGAMLLSSAMAHGTVIAVGDIYELPFNPLGNAPVHMAGGTLVAHLDAALTPLQKLVFDENTGNVVKASQFATLTIGGGVDLQGIAQFGDMGGEGVIQLTDGGPISVGPQGTLIVLGGTLANAAGQDALGKLTRQATSTVVWRDSTLDFQGGTAYIKNLQGSGTVNVGFGSQEALVVEQGNFAGALLGGSMFKKVSSGTLVLQHDQGIAGAIEIADGTLQVGGTGSYGSSGQGILNNGSLVFKGFTGGVSGDISGSGNLSATEHSLVALTGTNTYTGTTKIDPTSQIILADAGAPVDSSSTLGTGAVLNEGKLSNQRAGRTLIANGISGYGAVFHSSPGWLTLAGDNTYSGGTEITSGGTLEIGTGGSAGSLGTGYLTAAAGSTLIFNRGDDFSVANNMSYSESTLIKQGAGTMTVTGSTGGFNALVDIQSGTIRYVNGPGSSMIPPGNINIAQGAQVVFDNAEIFPSGERFTGQGTIRKTGAARFHYSGDGSGFSGSTIVDGGELYLANGALGGTVTINAGGRLQGTGRVGTTDILAGGMLVSSGYSRLRINGDLSLKDGSTFRYYLGDPGPDAANAGTTGSTRVVGNLDLNAKLQIRDNAQPTIGYYRLFTYGGTLSGNGLTLDTIPANHTRDQFLIDTTRAGFVDLRVAPLTTPGALLVWTGGSGTWGSGGMQWEADGQSGWSGTWGQQHAVFKGTAGQVSVSGTQAFKGLQFLTDGWQIGPLAGAGGALQTVGDGSELRVLAGVTATVGAPIQGSSVLDKTGGGTLVLNGVNVHTGGTRLSEGVLSVSQDASLGDGASDLMFNGGTLRVTGQSFSQTSRNLQWSTQGGAFDIASATNVFTVSQALSGAGDLVKLGAGTLVLTGNNAYGNTRVEAGTLVGNTDSIRGNLQNNGFVVFNQATSGTFGGDISGSGEATKAGAGVLTLSGRSAQNWRVTAGTLAASGGALSGNVDVGAAGALHLDAPQSSTYSGVLSGTGGFSKTGAGMLALIGDSAGFAGTTRIDQGILSVGINGQGKLGGQVTVAQSGVLQGTGTVGGTTVQAGGVIAPGNSIGTLHVAGDLTLEAGSVYRVEADSQSNESDRIAVSGTANLGGSVLHVGPDGNLAGERSYTILTANQINGAFSSASSEFAYLDANLGYEAQAVTLRLDRKRVPVEPSTPSTPGTRPMRFADAAGTSNQRGAANALDSLSGANPLYQYVLTLPEGAPAGVFDSLSGEAHASVTSGLNNLSGLSRNLPFKSLRANLDAGLAPGAATAQAGGTTPASALPGSMAQPAWAELVGTWQTLGGNDNASRVDQRTGGLFVGADHAVGGGWRLGGALGYTDSRIRVDANSSKADVDSYSATVYGGKAFQAGPGKINLLVGAGYTWHDISTTRNVAVAGQQDKLTADYGASTGQLFTEVGYAWPVAERTQLEPFAGVAWSDTRTRGFQESGGVAALSGQSNRNSLTTTTLGLRGKTTFIAGKTEGVLRAAAGWRHAFGDVESQTRLAFNGSQPFTVSGAPLARDAAFTELGVDIAVSRSATIGITYSGQFGGGNRENAGSVGVTWRY